MPQASVEDGCAPHRLRPSIAGRTRRLLRVGGLLGEDHLVAAHRNLARCGSPGAPVAAGRDQTGRR